MKSGEWGRRVFHRFPLEEDVERELESHLELCVEELVGAGWEPDEAREEALRRLGDRNRLARECLAVEREKGKRKRRGEMLDALWQDLRFTSRTLRKNPGFALVAIVTLAIGIGANTAVFSVVNGVLLRPLPFPDPHELVWVSERMESGSSSRVAWANFRDWHRESESFDGLTAFRSATTTVLGGAEPAWVGAAWVTRDFWTVFPVSPVAGRLTGEEDHREGAAPVIVVSQAFARQMLGEDDPLGRILELSGTRFEVVGVLPSEFEYPSGARLWYPFELNPQGDSRTAHNWDVVGRLRDGLTPAAAFAELEPLTRRLTAEDPDAGSSYLAAGVHVTPLLEETVGEARRPLVLLLGAAAFVLLVACTNLATTLLARGTTRAREVAIRSALGAPRGGIVRLFFSEAFVLAALGGLGGIGLAWALQRGILSLGANSIPRLESVALDGRALLFTLAVTVFTAVAFGLFPSLRVLENDQARTLRSEGRGNVLYRGRIWGMLLATDVALALVLLTGSGLLIRSFAAVLSEDGGFDEGDVAFATLALSGIKYPALDDHRRFWEEMLERAEAVPGVASAGVISSRPLSGFAASGRVELDGDPEKYGDAVYVAASDGVFETLDIPLLRGRLFDASDGPESEHKVVVSQSFADTYWPGEDPIGKLVSGGGMDSFWAQNPPVFGRVVGVVGEVRFRSLVRPGLPTVYWSFRQRPSRLQYGGNLMVESASGDPALVTAALRSVIREVDPDLAIRLRFYRDQVADSVAERRFILVVLSGFAGVALLLAGVGIYGVVSYSVARRSRETGIRLALGATRVKVRRMVVVEALRPVAMGLVLGLAGTFVLSRTIAGFLYGVRPTDPLTLTAVVLLLFATAWCASLVPAFRGTRVDPMVTMRAE